VNTSNGTAAQRVDYDTWGNATLVTGSWDVQPFGFAGGLSDPETKLVHFGAREYDPEVMRWTTPDPTRFEGGFNLYGYVDNDPVNFIDPFGLKTFSPSEVNSIMEKYKWELSRGYAYWTMHEKHKAGAEMDYSFNEHSGDFFDVPGLGVMNAAQFGNFMAGCGAGYQMDPVALQIVKGYGSWYAKHDVGLWEVAFFGGDNWDSVNHINQGWGYCFQQRWGSGPLACGD